MVDSYSMISDRDSCEMKSGWRLPCDGGSIPEPGDCKWEVLRNHRKTETDIRSRSHLRESTSGDIEKGFPSSFFRSPTLMRICEEIDVPIQRSDYQSEVRDRTIVSPSPSTWSCTSSGDPSGIVLSDEGSKNSKEGMAQFSERMPDKTKNPKHDDLERMMDV